MENQPYNNNPELELAYRFIAHTDTNLFLTGKAGTGKTTFLKELRKKSPKRMIVVAPTGVAAINAGGVTIHSFFQLPFSPYIPGSILKEEKENKWRYKFSKEKTNIIRSLDLLVIDEISMVRADLLDAIDAVLRRYKDHKRPFGGIQLLMIGDLQQLSPVATDNEAQLLAQHYPNLYFFGSHALQKSSYITLELKRVYRQNDPEFVGILNAIREQRADESLLARLNQRYQPDFNPTDSDGYIRLTTHNHTAQAYNEKRLAGLPDKPYTFMAQIKGTFAEGSYPAEKELTLKRGAQVMFIKNDDSGQQRFYNGKIGHVKMVTEQGVIVKSEEGIDINVEPTEWSNTRYTLNEETNEITEVTEGTFRQYPLRLAWAITIHKSQGLTFEKAVIDANTSFAHGQVYVALSRCKSLQGLVLASPLSQHAIICDHSIDDFMVQSCQEAQQAIGKLAQLQYAYFGKLLDEMFDFAPLLNELNHFTRILDEHFYRLYPILLERYKNLRPQMEQQIKEVSEKFKRQYAGLMNIDNYTTSPLLQERINKAANYFLQQLEQLLTGVLQDTSVETDNKAIKKRTDESLYTLRETFKVKRGVMEHFATAPFTTAEYLKKKACLLLDNNGTTVKRTKRKRQEKETVAPEMLTDVHNPQLFSQLREWRLKKSQELRLPAYTIMQQKALIAISNLKPQTVEALITVPYFGKKGAEKFGQEILEIIQMNK